MDFFVSYTGADQGWAEWVAWQLEAAGYRTVIQAWDFGAGSQFVHEMHAAVGRARRTVAVLSAAYLRSAFAAAEWQAAWAADPSGEQRRLLVFRVEDCDRPGLLHQRVSVDLFGVGEEQARDRLLAAAGGERGKPSDPPAFPGTAAGRTRAAPAFPGAAGWRSSSLPPRNPVFTGRAGLVEGLGAGGVRAVDALAGMVRDEWQQEIRVRKLDQRAPIDIPWRVERQSMPADLYAEIDRTDLSGSLLGVPGLFERWPSRQLVILGGPGSGKSVLALYLVTKLIELRSVGDPVPVLLSISGWQPRAIALDAWVARRIDETYQAVRAHDITEEVLQRLLRDGQIIPILDGLDEIPMPDRSRALDILSSVVGSGRPLVLTCRGSDYQELRVGLSAALAITLQPIDVESALHFVTAASPAGTWDAVRERMIKDPAGPIGTALRVPLMAWLARTVYASMSDRTDRSSSKPPQPDELLSLRTSEAISQRLFSKLTPTLYNKEPDLQLAGTENFDERYADGILRLISHQLAKTNSLDIEWWELHSLTPQWARILFMTIAVYASASVGVTASWIVPQLHSVAWLLTVAALIFGPFLGVGIAVAGPPDRPTRLRFGLLPRTSGRRALNAPEFRLLVGVVVGGLSAVLGDVLTRNVSFAVGLLLVGALIGGMFTLFGTPEIMDSATPDNLYAADRVAFYAFAAVGVLGTGAGGAVVGFLTDGFSAPICGAWAGAVCGALVGVTLARRLPYIAAIAVSVSTGVALGLLVGWLAGGGVHGTLTTAMTGAGLGLCLGVATGLASTSTGWLLLTEGYLALFLSFPKRRLLTFLNGAHRCGLLRREGAVYKFRHVMLQNWFAETSPNSLPDGRGRVERLRSP